MHVEGGKHFAFFPAPSIEEGGGAGKTYTHLLSQQQNSRDSTLSVFLRKQNGAKGEFLRTNSKKDQGQDGEMGQPSWDQ